MRQSVLLLLTCFAAVAFGSQGTIRGKVTDSRTKEALPGCNVFLFSSSLKQPLGTATDRQGKYTITDVPPGEYVAKASCVGYKSGFDTLVIRKAPDTLNVNFRLTANVPIVEIDTIHSIENYQRYLSSMKPGAILSIRIDSVGPDNVPFSRHVLFTTFYNETDTPIYVIKDSLLVQSARIIVTNDKGVRVPGGIFVDYTGMRGVLDSSDLIKIPPHDSIDYTVHMYYNNLDSYPAGDYNIRMAYEYRRVSWFNAWYLNASVKVASYVFNTGLRGYFPSSNSIVYRVRPLKPH